MAIISTPQQPPISSTEEAAQSTRRPATLAEEPRRGFAAMDPVKRRLLASIGGRASQDSGRGHKWTPEEASEAGRKGGEISRRGPKPKAK